MLGIGGGVANVHSEIERAPGRNRGILDVFLTRNLSIWRQFVDGYLR